MTPSVLDGFIQFLRRGGFRISPSERVDASRAALAVGVESRLHFRSALRATLAKTPEESRLFDSLFDAHFASPSRKARQGEREDRGGSGDGGGGHGEGSGSARRAAPPSESPGSARGARPKGQKIPLQDRKAGRSRPPDQSAVGIVSPVRGRLRRVIVSGAERKEADRSGGRDGDRSSRGVAAGGPRRVDLASALTSADEAALAREIPAIIQEIRLRRGRRFREGRRGRLWAKKMIRDSLAHGGVPFTLPMKERRPRSPRVLVLVDVSWSVARAAGLFLLICRGLAERLRRAEFHFFVDRVAEATAAVRAWPAANARRAGRRAPAPPDSIRVRPRSARGNRRGGGAPGGGIVPRPGGIAFADLVGAVPGLNIMAPSDYGRAFFQARQVLGRAGGRDTVLVVLGDARTNRRDPLAWAFEEIAARCRRVIWLNPEPRRLWNSEDSVMDAYLPACDVACEVRDLDGLARGVREILRAL